MTPGIGTTLENEDDISLRFHVIGMMIWWPFTSLWKAARGTYEDVAGDRPTVAKLALGGIAAYVVAGAAIYFTVWWLLCIGLIAWAILTLCRLAFAFMSDRKEVD